MKMGVTIKITVKGRQFTVVPILHEQDGVVERMEERNRPGPNLKVPSRHLPGGTEENPGKPHSGWPPAGLEPTTSRMRSQRSTTELRPLGSFADL